jgi:hypothetical protein
MYANRDKRFYLSLLLNTVFVFKQLGISLFLCIVFHSHSHIKEAITPVSNSADPVICCLHCDHRCEGHTSHQIDISQTTLPEEEHSFPCLTAAFDRGCSQYFFRAADPAGYIAENCILQTFSPPLRSTVMRC